MNKLGLLRNAFFLQIPSPVSDGRGLHEVKGEGLNRLFRNCPKFRERLRIHSSRGGILFDVFLILLTVAVGAYIWFLLDNRHASKPALVWESNPADSRPVHNINERSAWLQGEVRKILLQHGIDEVSVSKNYTQQRSGRGAQWVEDTLQIIVPDTFDEGKFFKDLQPVIQKEGFQIIKNTSIGGKWTLEMGDHNRVFERLIIKKSS